jgi:transposase-like protein
MGDMEPLSLTDLAAKVPDEASAYLLLEELRWQGRPVCPHCASVGEHYFLTPANGTTRKTRTGAQTARRLWKCQDCRKQFSVLTGTIMHRTKVPIRTWLFVLFEMSASKNGMAAREIERKYRVTPRTAWHMAHRIREAMRREPLTEMMTGTVEVDETYIGGSVKNKHRQGRKYDASELEPWKPRADLDDKVPVLTLVSRETGEARSQVMRRVTGENIAQTLKMNMAASSGLVTDQASWYRTPGQQFASHESVNHSEHEYVRGAVYTNTVEGFFSQLKRSIDGTHHYVSTEHLHRYLAEFDFRYSTCKMSDNERMGRIIANVAGRRLAYRASSSSGSDSLVA